MSKIKILSEHLANQIAAGEVIERPASVVKEFLENSIDAGSEQISIQVEGGGTRLVRVIDDGAGMDADDVLLCLERHATSKLSDTDDDRQLTSISTLGFRGEAIPSIASVSQLTITSRTEASDLGTCVVVKYGKVMKVHETGCGKGTVMEVRNLFGNVPARKKFLKSNRTELYHIEETIKNYALANYYLGMTYEVNNRTVINLPAQTDTLETRTRKIFGNITARLIPVEGNTGTSNGSDHVKISGYLLLPGELAATSAKLRMFVNGRAIRDRMVIHAVKEGLANFLMKGTSPSGVLFISLPPDSVDVNVHPTKQEIRFHKANAIHQLVVSSVRNAIEQHQEYLKFSVFGAPDSQISENNQIKGAEQNTFTGNNWGQQGLPLARSKGSKSYPKPFTSRRNPSHGTNVPTTETPFINDIPQGHNTSPSANADHSVPETITGETSPSEYGQEQRPEVIQSLNPIGQVFDLYILCESKGTPESSFVVIDQHAAHERIIFENLKKQFSEKNVPSQALLFPKVLEFNPSQARILEKYEELITLLGFRIDDFGDGSYVVKSVPAILAHLTVDELMAGVFAEFSMAEKEASGQNISTSNRFDGVLSAMACKAAIKAGRSLEPEEIESLLEQMQESNVFSHCPHGRPVIKSFNADDMKKWFYRT